MRTRFLHPGLAALAHFSRRVFLCGLIIPALLSVLLLPTTAGAAQPIRVASKIDTEGELLGYLIVLALQEHKLPIENRVSLGNASIVRRALLAGEIDLYPEYTGNGAFFSDTADDPVWKKRGAGYQRVKAFDAEENQIVWLPPAPANNTWAIAVTADLARANKLATMEDFAAYIKQGGALKLAASAEFVDSPLALPSFQQTYDFKLDTEQILVLSGGNTAATIRAAAEGINDANAAMVYGTDGGIVAADLVVLEDNLGAQAVYAPAAIVRAKTLQDYPQITEILTPVFTSLDLKTLQRLNAEIQVNGRAAKKVAEEYLQQKELISLPAVAQ